MPSQKSGALTALEYSHGSARNSEDPASAAYRGSVADDDPDDWSPARQQRIARWVMLFAVAAFVLLAIGGSLLALL
jgi:hypothetical protein